MARSLALAALVLACVAVPAACRSDGAQAEEPGPSRLLAEQGEALYLRYCASCHGLDAQGGGPAAPALRTPPSDLTRIAARRGGVFPESEVAAWIDGRFMAPVHGAREMPIWGVQLRYEQPRSGLEEEIVRGQLDMLVEYLESIQAREGEAAGSP